MFNGLKLQSFLLLCELSLAVYLEYFLPVRMVIDQCVHKADYDLAEGETRPEPRHARLHTNRQPVRHGQRNAIEAYD